MKELKRILLTILCFCAVQQAQAQQPEPEPEVEEYASPGVRGMGRGRGVVIGYERLPGFDIDSESDDPRIGGGNGKVRRHNKFSTRVVAPVVNKPQTKVIVGVDYQLEEFNFEGLTPTSYPLYRYLEDKNLKSLGLQVAYLHSLDARRFYLVRLKGELNGDYNRDDINVSDYLKVNVEAAYGWKKSPDFAIGVGLQLGYTFGRQSVYPGILYNRTFNDKWGVESIFPANARLRYNLNEKTLLYGGYRLEGSSYNMYIDETPLSSFGELELRRTDIKALLRLEREIYDFIWFSVEGGFRQYYRHRVFDEIGSRDPLITNDLAGAGYVGVELFLVAPRKWIGRNAGK
ncbi:DUF6268 family outer membrane beta-barrel protein [uncultured Pontibacter sp.]|uniref:DUF6268 family outer membrane beta-barrel protein n=1 Tax=uncultured Pontibacter sp. TaxID=453356 RepID=UPI0026023D53|nr:DUF6268 family outer membrane beta-barrel protein [uncultured Pontibacter sp.]